MSLARTKTSRRDELLQQMMLRPLTAPEYAELAGSMALDEGVEELKRLDGSGESTPQPAQKKRKPERLT